MLGNLKDFISVVQDGLSSNNNLRHTLQEVQKVTNIFRDKQHKAAAAATVNKVNYEAGGALLQKYQNQWAEIHENADTNAKEAEEVDKLIIELHEMTKVRLQSANELAHSLAQLPALTASVAECMNSLRNVQELMRSVEEDLVSFEDMVERDKMEKWKLDHHYELAMYKERKMAALEKTRMNLARENSQQSYHQEKRQLAELQARREHSAVAFQEDISKYLSSGSVPSGSPSPHMTLEQVQLEDDPTDLEKFLST